jgi:hypothetical protein
MYKIIIPILILTFFSCGQKQVEMQATQRLESINQLIENKNYEQALLAIDSFHVEFRNLIPLRRKAASLQDSALLYQSVDIQAYCDSVLYCETQSFDSIVKNFKYEKNENYQAIGVYVSKNQISENNTERNFLKCSIDDHAEFALESVYAGKKLEHRNIRVTADSISIDSEHSGAFHSFNDDDIWHESLIFSAQNQSNIAGFIAQNRTKRIKVTLLGDSNFSYILADRDKTAIAESYEFWLIKKNITKLENKRNAAKIMQQKILLRKK